MKNHINTLLGFFLVTITISLNAQENNISKNAAITASSYLNENMVPQNISDGIIGVDNQGEWACKGERTSWGYIELPWIRMEWEKPQTINRIVIYDRASEKEYIAGGKISFSDGTSIWVRQLPNNGFGKEISFEAKTIEWLKFEAIDAEGKDVGLSEIEVFTAPEESNEPIGWVDPYIETNRGRYLFFITGSRPFGMVGAAPLTRNKNQYGGGYNYNEDSILGFEQIHSWMLGGLEIMPTSANIDPRSGQKSWKSKYSHEDEIVRPGYHRVFLRDHKIWTEFTSTQRVSFYNFRFTESMETQIITNLGGYVSNNLMENADVKKVSSTEIEGSFSTTDRFWGGPKDVKVFFVAEFDKPFDSLKAWKGDEIFENADGVRGDDAGVAPIYNVRAGDELKMKIAISYTSIENARKNLDTELSHWDFSKVSKDSWEEWNNWLGKINVEGGTHDQRTKFYTDLWHVLLGRQKINDVSGDYPDRTSGIRDGNFTDAEFKVKTLPKDSKRRINVQYV